jgi:hypothetical protein
MSRLWAMLVVLLGSALASTVVVAQQAQGPAGPPPLPAGVELPMNVRLAVRVLNITRIQEVQREMSAAIEFTQRWTDPSLQFDRVAAGGERMDMVGAEAEARLSRIWQPAIAIENMIGQPRAQTAALSVFHDGRVVLIRRLDAEFRVDLTMAAFPFDQQRLVLRFASQRHPAAEVALLTTEFDMQFSGLQSSLSVANWDAGSLSFSQESFFGWNARPYARLVAVATVERQWPRYILRIFVPFFALMSLSLFLYWASDRVIEQKARAPMVFSSLLALAALSFTFESSFPGAISLNSPIATMISLGYFYLPFVLLTDAMLTSQDSALARRYPALIAEMRRNVRWTVPMLFFGFCLLLLLLAADRAVRIV